ncbi:hypothetical protein BHE74_00048179 [Ensete ventricosum]|nr:hypothetical protein GW17_00058045 [Ensete ventricosum]RWW45943.1 hypothetical protein BHE74_00048179 [Ensete ventricosum]
MYLIDLPPQHEKGLRGVVVVVVVVVKRREGGHSICYSDAEADRCERASWTPLPHQFSRTNLSDIPMITAV